MIHGEFISRQIHHEKLFFILASEILKSTGIQHRESGAEAADSGKFITIAEKMLLLIN